LTSEEHEVYVAWMNWFGVVAKTSAVFCRVLEKGIVEQSYNKWYIDYVNKRQEFQDYLAANAPGEITVDARAAAVGAPSRTSLRPGE
jgi:hypothetical protein